MTATGQVQKSKMHEAHLAKPGPQDGACVVTA